ncbi:MAG: YigZ family protein [Firmicutes bacterium]|nr:YigZ family protein [Bacillota bacterium]
MYLYKTVYEYGEAEIVIEKSRFIARVMPIESYEEGQTFVAEIKQQYKDATHNVPAIIFGRKQEMQWASDDGEPSGTSGMPMLKVMADMGLTNLAVVVTRYFGGVKLGTGGLSRAYSSLAKAGIEAAGICEVKKSIDLDCQMEYTYFPRVQNSAKDGLFEIHNIEYSDKVSMTVSCMEENGEEMKSRLQNLTLGQVLITEEKNILKKFKI